MCMNIHRVTISKMSQEPDVLSKVFTSSYVLLISSRLDFVSVKVSSFLPCSVSDTSCITHDPIEISINNKFWELQTVSKVYSVLKLREHILRLTLHIREAVGVWFCHQAVN